jgi:hypothetical protein
MLSIEAGIVIYTGLCGSFYSCVCTLVSQVENLEHSKRSSLLQAARVLEDLGKIMMNSLISFREFTELMDCIE